MRVEIGSIRSMDSDTNSGDVCAARCDTGEKFSQHARVCDSWFRRCYPLTDGIIPDCDRFSMGSRTRSTFLTRALAGNSSLDHRPTVRTSADEWPVRPTLLGQHGTPSFCSDERADCRRLT